ncbi:DUF948 domain-containing protein [Shouchella lonarensis]|uniref:Uncharacterized protein YoxC, contains an MCP-like domain n=1 Tax=Shouchella lonarensis TaxID=1464122 RepID=A0A1G6GGY6_9BACI|nr:DUF948 domain-containing protein [Shouchella lonarensis]SDB81210.1 Uncharacterized protein YoxC, contains an MCP-like domain [Shouchella lonarensis]
MEWILYGSTAVVALSFALLCIYLIQATRKATKTLEHTSATVEALKQQLEGVSSETEQLLKKTNVLADDVKRKSDAIHHLFESAQELGDAVKTVNQSVRQASVTISEQTSKNAKTVSQAVQWGQAVLDFYTKLKARKAQKEAKEKGEGQHG